LLIKERLVAGNLAEQREKQTGLLGVKELFREFNAEENSTGT